MTDVTVQTNAPSTTTLNNNDHDLLISLNTKFDIMQRDIKDLKDGISSRVGQLEIKAQGYDKILYESNPSENIKRLNEVYEWKHDFQFTYRFMIGFAVGLGSLITFILTVLGFILRIIKV